MKISKKYFYILVLLLLPAVGFSQFDSEASKTTLYDNVNDMRVYLQMSVKDKLYLINGQQVKFASKEFDYAIAKVDESINVIDLNVTDPKLKKQVERIKELWGKLNAITTKEYTNKEFLKVYYQVNLFDKMIFDLSESMFVVYNLPSEAFEQYRSTQKLRFLIQKTSFSYYANYLGLSKSVLHEYEKNINEIDTFIKQKSNLLLNDNNKEQIFVRIISDWNFFRANLFHQKMKNIRTIFSLSTSMDYKLDKLKHNYLDKLDD